MNSSSTDVNANAALVTSESEAQTRYRSIVHSAMDAIISIDADNHITEFNPAAEVIFGHRREDVMGCDLANLIVPPEMRLAHREGLLRHRDSSTAPRLGRRIALEALRSDGSRFPVELTVTRDGGASPPQFTAFIRDLSQQRIAETRAQKLAEELKASERLLAGVLSNLPGMAFQCDLGDDAPFEFVSDASVQLCGYSPSEFLSRQVQWESLIQHGDHANLARARKAALRHHGHYECTYEIRTRAGTLKWVMEQGMITAAPSDKSETSDATQSRTTWIDGLIVDVTATTLARQQIDLLNAELEARVRRRTAELETVNAELETFSYSIAHDLRAPLTSIAGFARIIEEKVGPRAELAHFFNRIRTGIRHMDELIDAMLSLAKIKRSVITMEPVDLAEQAREIVERLMQAEPERKVDLDVPANVWVRGDAILLRQVMENLIGNAWKFSRKAETTSIRISCVAEGSGECVVSIEDKGAGFDPDGAERLFKPFMRLHARDEFEGTGIGLAVVHRIVAHHAGKIWATAQPGAGACFSFSLPVASGDAAARVD